jgi:hypothetical protein
MKHLWVASAPKVDNKDLQVTQQQAVDQLKVVQDQLVAQMAETKKLSERTATLTEKLNALQGSAANIPLPHPSRRRDSKSLSWLAEDAGSQVWPIVSPWRVFAVRNQKPPSEFLQFEALRSSIHDEPHFAKCAVCQFPSWDPYFPAHCAGWP